MDNQDKRISHPPNEEEQAADTGEAVPASVFASKKKAFLNEIRGGFIQTDQKVSEKKPAKEKPEIVRPRRPGSDAKPMAYKEYSFSPDHLVADRNAQLLTVFGEEGLLAVDKDGYIRTNSNALPVKKLAGEDGPFVAVAANNHYVVALRENGTVCAYDEKGEAVRLDEDLFYDVRTIAANSIYVLGLRGDGTVVSYDSYTKRSDVLWEDIAILSGASTGEIFAIRKDGTIRHKLLLNTRKIKPILGCRDIVSITGGGLYTIVCALHEDGTVYSSKKFRNLDVDSIRGAVQVEVFLDELAVLTGQGTILASDKRLRNRVEKLREIVAVKFGGNFLYVVRRDGTILQIPRFLADKKAYEWALPVICHPAQLAGGQ